MSYYIWEGFGVYVRMPEGYEEQIISDAEEAWNMIEQVWAIEKGWGWYEH